MLQTAGETVKKQEANLYISEIGLDQGRICIQFEMHFDDDFLVEFANDGQNGGKWKVFEKIVVGG